MAEDVPSNTPPIIVDYRCFCLEPSAKVADGDFNEIVHVVIILFLVLSRHLKSGATPSVDGSRHGSG